MSRAIRRTAIDPAVRRARTMVKAATAVAVRCYRVPKEANPILAALLVDLDRADGHRTEYERVAAELGIETGLAILVPRAVSNMVEDET